MSHLAFRLLPRLGLTWLALAAVRPAAHAQTLEKVADFRNVIVNSLYVGGSSNPYDNSVQIGNRLWFTTQAGGLNDAGTISYYDLTTRTITAFVSMDNTSGKTPLSSVTAIGNTLYFTTTRGGSGDTGTVSSVNIASATPSITPLYNFGAGTGTGGSVNNPRTPAGGFTALPGQNGGTDLYFSTSNGGTAGSAYGTISKYNTLSGTTSVVYNFGVDGGSGRQPMEGFTNVGGKLYFTTFTGGGTGTVNGSGSLSVLDPASGAVSVLASMPGGGAQFPAHNVMQAANGMLYFTTAGTSTQPGGLQSFNLGTGTLSTVYSLTGAATASGPFPDGKQAYGSVLELNNALYFTTIMGGAYNRGTIDAFNLSTNTFSKLYDLDGGTADALSYLGQEARGGFTLVRENGQDYLYLLTRAGGLYNSGTLLRITPIPEPGSVVLLAAAGTAGWLARRRRVPPNASSSPTLRAVPARPRGAPGAFTLVELIVVISIVAVLASVALPVLNGFSDRSREAVCLSNLRQIGAAYLLYAADHNGNFPTADAIGNSNFRGADDPLGLPVLFTPYLGNDYSEQGKIKGTKIWLCPGGRPTLKAYGTNYAWSRADNVAGRPATAIVNASSTALVWDNFTMTLPSIINVPEATGGPRAANTQYRYYAHRLRTKANYLFADGHAGVL